MRNFNFERDLYEDPQVRKLFGSEEENLLPLKELQAHFYYAHPSSYLYELEPSAKLQIIRKDILNDSEFNLQEDVLEKINKYTLTKAERLLDAWQQKLEERSAFIASRPYSESTYDMLDDMMSKSSKMWQEYSRILKEFTEDSSTTHGGVEESFLEKL